mmetsp:Transcript_21934/g.66649  ORF Transcript_21934/g.66649 Transcript_21934/m.66649 type:complete len:101 (+) Transcript_21934:333-635(+)|eukprot:scaffold35605_cov31-Tisochrysis_lutea.AAC.2
MGVGWHHSANHASRPPRRLLAYVLTWPPKPCAPSRCTLWPLKDMWTKQNQTRDTKRNMRKLKCDTAVGSTTVCSMRLGVALGSIVYHSLLDLETVPAHAC